MQSDINPEQFKERLLNDPNYLINFIIDNNFEEVRARAISLEFGGFDTDISVKGDLVEVVNYLISKQNFKDLKYLLSVPVKADRFSPIYYGAFESSVSDAYNRLIEMGVYINQNNPIL